MHMWYWFDVDLGDFLFPGYNVTTVWSFLATCLGLAALVVLYEAMKVFQMHLQQITVGPVPREISASSESSSLLSRVAPRTFATLSYTRCGSCSKWMLQVMHWSLHTTIGYILMLAVMTYNAYITIALVIGGGLGYWIFGHTLVQLNMQRFNRKRIIVECDKDCESNAMLTNEKKCDNEKLDN